MAHTLAGAIANLQDKAASLSGFRQAPDFAKESINQLPASIAFPKSSESKLESYGLTHVLETVTVLLLFASGSLPKAIAKADSYYDDFLILIRDDPTLTSNVSNVVSVNGTFGVISYGKLNYIGWTIDVVYKRTI